MIKNQPADTIITSSHCSVHPANESVDETFPVAMVSSLNEMPRLLSIASTSIAQLERPQEIVSLLEVGSNGEDLVHQILHADNAFLPKHLEDTAYIKQMSTTPFLHWIKGEIVHERLCMRDCACEIVHVRLCM